MPKTPHSSRRRSSSSPGSGGGSSRIMAPIRCAPAGPAPRSASRSILLGRRGRRRLVDNRVQFLFVRGGRRSIALLLRLSRRRGWGGRRGGGRGRRRRRRRRSVGRGGRRRPLVIRLLGNDARLALEQILDRLLGVLRQQLDDAILSGEHDRSRLGVLHPLRLLRGTDEPVENCKGDHRQQKAAGDAEKKAERAV